MSTITGSISLTSNIQQTGSAIPGALPLATQQTAKFAPASPAGTAGTADNCDLKYSKVLVLSATPSVLDLTSLLDPFGNTISFARVRSILVVNTSTVSSHIVNMGYSSTTTNAWTGLLSNPGQIGIGPSTATNSGVLFVSLPNTNGWVVSSSSKLMQFDPGAFTTTINVEILGCSV